MPKSFPLLFLRRKIFQEKDTKRYTDFLEACHKGETKLSAATLLPHSIVDKYLKNYALETKWRSLFESLRSSPEPQRFDQCTPTK